jgi:hypothetical protein
LLWPPGIIREASPCPLELPTGLIFATPG